MLGHDVNLQWWRDIGGYILKKGTAPVEVAAFGTKTGQRQVAVRDEFIVGRTGIQKEFKSLEAFDNLLYREFAKVIDARTALNFVNRFAPLTSDGLKPHGERLSVVLSHARKLRRYLDAYSGKRPTLLLELIGTSGEALGMLDLSLMPNFKTKRFELRSAPKDLVTLIWVQFGRVVAGGIRIRSCGHCGSLFEAGPGAERRLDAQFCSDEHRTAFNSLKRSRKK